MPRLSFAQIYGLVESGEAATADRVSELLGQLGALADRLEAAVKGVPSATAAPEAPMAKAVPDAPMAKAVPQPTPPPPPAPAAVRGRENRAAAKQKYTVANTGRNLLHGLGRYFGIVDHVEHVLFLNRVISEAGFTDDAMEIVKGIRDVAAQLKDEYERVAKQTGHEELLSKLSSRFDDFESRLSQMGGPGGGQPAGEGGRSERRDMDTIKYNLVQHIGPAFNMVAKKFSSTLPEGAAFRDGVLQIQIGKGTTFIKEVPYRNMGSVLRTIRGALMSPNGNIWTLRINFPPIKVGAGRGKTIKKDTSKSSQYRFEFDIESESESISAASWIQESAVDIFNELVAHVRKEAGKSRVGLPGQAQEYDPLGPGVAPRPDDEPIKLPEWHRRSW